MTFSTPATQHLPRVPGRLTGGWFLIFILVLGMAACSSTPKKTPPSSPVTEKSSVRHPEFNDLRGYLYSPPRTPER